MTLDNPFHRRATEQLRDDEAFLSIVSPHPLTVFLKRPAEQGTLYDRLVVIRGTPGSGKTTLARLFEFSAVSALLRRTGSTDYESVAGALEECRAIRNNYPVLLGCRLPMETDYRDFWEFPYTESLKSGLLFTFIQARAVLAWFRQLRNAGIAESEVEVVPRADAEAAVETIGGRSGSAVAQKAREVERAIYDVVGALVAPKEATLTEAVAGAYRPFDVLEHIRVASTALADGRSIDLSPLVILDDAHCLHPAQFHAVERWLARRELRICRWVITRFDILQPGEALSLASEDRATRPSYSGLSAARDVESVLLQNWGQRREQRTAFRRMARDMAERYLQKHPLLGPRRLVDISALLGEEAEPMGPSKVREVAADLVSLQRKLSVTDSRRAELSALVDAYHRGGRPVPEDVKLTMLSILMHRYANRTMGQTTFLVDDPEPSRPLVANAGVYEAARLHLMHQFSRSFYYGFEDLCDCSCENAELFLQLSAVLVDMVVTQIIRSKPATLTSTAQHRLLRERAQRIISAWSFPYVEEVRSLVQCVAKRCVETSLQPNGWLTPNAYGIPQPEFEDLPTKRPEVARVLHYAVAYNAILLAPHYECKGKEWCLLEMGGPVCLSYGLTLRRGGFLEGTSSELAAVLRGVQQ